MDPETTISKCMKSYYDKTNINMNQDGFGTITKRIYRLLVWLLNRYIILQ
eukprot:UN20542